jgi:hypothetical protein
MARQKGSRTGRCQGCNHLKGAARNFAIDYQGLRRHWRNHVSAEARAAYIAGAGASKDQLEEIVAEGSLGLILGMAGGRPDRHAEHEDWR